MRLVWLAALLGFASGVPVARRAVATELKEDECQKYVSIKVSEVDPKSKSEHLQLDDGYCEANCKKGFCPKESCKCDPNYVPPDPAKPKVVPVRTMTPTEARAAAAIKDADEAREKAEQDDTSGADKMLAEREAIAQAAEEARSERENAALDKAAEERHETEKGRADTAPLSAADAAAAGVAAAADAVAAMPDIPLPAVAPPVAPFDPGDCPNFVALKAPKGEELFAQADDEYCEATRL